ncbi:MAG: hypothetical protein V4572_11675 [Bacteroidota bacterium]
MKLKLFTLTSLFLLNTALIQAQTTTSLPTSAGNGGTYNSSFGDQAGNAGNNNSVFGYKAGDLVTGAGEYNSFFGANTGVSNTTGKDNVFVGYKTGYKNFDGSRNVFIGRESGYENASGYNNVFTGYESGHQNIGGYGNVFSGYKAGYTNSSGYSNVFIGRESGYANSIGNYNIFIGYRSGMNSKGDGNVYIGRDAGMINTGSFNTFLGYRSGYNNTIGVNNVFLGNLAGSNETGSNRLYIDNTATATPLIFGKFDTRQLGINTNNIPVGYAMAIKGKLALNAGSEGQTVAVNAFSIIGPNVPTGNNSAQDLSWDFTAAGSAKIRSYRGASWDTYMQFLTSPNSVGIAQVRMHIGSEGNVGIGTANPDQKLTVNGTIHSKEVIVDNAIAPDYVFQKYYTGKSELKSDYTMPTLNEVAEFTKANNHLPNIPSAKEMQQNGVSLGKMNNLLLQKVEELTLYAIEQQKKLDDQNKTIDSLVKRLDSLEKK